MEKILTYKGKPLVRKDNMMYYGNMFDKFVVMIQVVSSKKEGDLEIAEKVRVQLINTDPNVSPQERVVKNSEKKGLYEAMDIGSVWLERALG